MHELPAAPKLNLTGKIVQVSVSPGGVPKRAVATGLIFFRGIEGDSWAKPQIHGGPDQAILLIAAEVIEALRAQGFPVYPGALGENLTTEGLDTARWRVGQIYRVGSARLQLTKPRTPCRTLHVYGPHIGRAIYDARVQAGDSGSPVWGHSGIYARVLTEGSVRASDAIELESEVA